MSLFNRNYKPDTPPVILLDGGIVSLSVARSLGRRGIPVYALDIPQNHARFSRFSKRIPFRGDNVPAWVEWLTGEGLNQYRGAVIFPCSDDAVEMAARHRVELAEHYFLPEVKENLLLAMLDKAETYKLAEKIGVPAPKTWVVNDRKDIEAIIDRVPFPCALKPRYSHEFRGKQFMKKLFIVNSREELLREFNHIHNLGIRHKFRSDLIVTEVIPGEGEDLFQSYYSYLDEEGTPLFHFTKRKLRQYPNDSGNGTYHMTDWNPEVAEVGLKFLKGIGYFGLGAVEFKRDPRDGVLKLMECNPRLTNATELIRQCGFDIALFVYNRLAGQPLPPPGEYRRGVRLIRPLRDFLSFRDAHRRGLLTWKQWLGSVLHRQHFEAFAWSDPLPWVMMTYYYMKRIMKLERSPRRDQSEIPVIITAKR